MCYMMCIRQRVPQQAVSVSKVSEGLGGKDRAEVGEILEVLVLVLEVRILKTLDTIFFEKTVKYWLLTVQINSMPLDSNCIRECLMHSCMTPTHYDIFHSLHPFYSLLSLTNRKNSLYRYTIGVSTIQQSFLSFWFLPSIYNTYNSSFSTNRYPFLLSSTLEDIHLSTTQLFSLIFILAYYG